MRSETVKVSLFIFELSSFKSYSRQSPLSRPAIGITVGHFTSYRETLSSHENSRLIRKPAFG